MHTWEWDNILKAEAEEIKRTWLYKYIVICNGVLLIYQWATFCLRSLTVVITNVNCTTFSDDLPPREVNPSLLLPSLMALHHPIFLLVIQQRACRLSATEWISHSVQRYSILNFVFYVFVVQLPLLTLEKR